MTDTTPKHPGKTLFDQVMTPLGVSRNKLARDIDVPVGRISDIVAGKRGVTPDTALRFAKYFGTTAELWLRLQADFDLHVARSTTWRDAEPKVAEFEPARNTGAPQAVLPATAPVTDNYPREVTVPSAPSALDPVPQESISQQPEVGYLSESSLEASGDVPVDPLKDEFDNPLSTVRPDDEDIDIPEPLTAGMSRPEAG